MNIITFTSGEVSRFYDERISHLTQKGTQWSCGCPRHGGKDANFKVEAATGRWYCHSVCGCGGDIIDLEMSLTGADFKTAKAEVFRIVGRIEPRHTTGGWREIERYPYTDPDGNLLLEVVRFLKLDGKKTFVQVRPSGVEAAGTTDPERIGGVPTGGIVIGLSKGKYLPDPKAERATGKPTWKRASDQVDYDGAEYRFRDCPRVPYRLPKVVGAETVYLPEGEKDVHTLESWGLVASCNPGGSGESHLYTGWADYFRNRHVVAVTMSRTFRGTGTLTAHGERYLEEHGVPIPVGRRGGAAHEYWRQTLKNVLERHGYDTVAEFPVSDGRAVDLHGVKGDHHVYIEVETGKSDIGANIAKCTNLPGSVVFFFVTSDLRAAWQDRIGGALGITPTELEQLTRLLG